MARTQQLWEGHSASHDELIEGSVSVTATAAALPTQPISEVDVQADFDNLVYVLVGNSVNQRFQLAPGQSLTVRVTNLDRIYHKTASGTAVLNYLGR